LRKIKSPASRNRRAFVAHSAAGRRVKTISGHAHADTNGIPSTLAGSAQPACTSGLRRNAFRASAGRRTRIGTRTEKLRFAEVRILQRADTLPATGIAGHLTEIIDYELGCESRFALPDRPERLVRNVTGKCLRSSTPAIRTLIIGQELLRSWELGDASRHESTLG